MVYKGERHINPLVLTNGTVVTPFRVAKNHCIVVEDGRISQLGTFDNVFLPPGARIIDVHGNIVGPGFIDLHVHGGKGRSFNGGNEGDFDEITGFHRAHGTTLMLATLYVDDKERYLRTLENLSAYCAKSKNQLLYGIHLEGPFINRAMKGALNEEYIWEANIPNWHTLKKAGGDYIRMITLAPELAGTEDVMQLAAQDGIVIGMAHSEARYEDIELAIDNGLTQVTHIFNSMHPLHHRNPGVITAALLKRELKVHLIGDCVHVHPAVIELLYKLKGPTGIVLITDAVSATGQEDGTYSMAGRQIHMKGGKVYLKSGTLAGSVITLEKAVKNLVDRVSIPFQEAIRMASLNPARVLGLDHKKGILAVGKDADMVVLNSNYEVRMTIIGGEICFDRQG